MSEKEISIYKITNIVNNYVYVGSTSRTLEQRLKAHLKPNNLKDAPNSLFYKDIEKYGRENFKIELLDTCFERHRFIIEEYWWNKLYKEGNCMYDIKRGATHSENTIQRIARLRNQEDKQEIYKTDEFKQKISEATSGENNGMFGKKDEEALNGRIVIAFYDKEHTKIYKTFPSVKVALIWLGIKGHTKLNQCCRTNELYHGYYWSKEWIDR